MSSLIVEVCAIEEIQPHKNADRLERVRVKNWWCIAGKDHYKIGDKAVYLPPDSIISEELANRWGIAKYCAPLARGIDGVKPPGLRIRANRFRGEPSFGCLQDPDDASWPIGKDVKEHYGISKWEPPVKALDGDAAPNVASFHAYTDIENIGNFPNVFAEGEEVVVTEKIHGTNSRVGYVCNPEEAVDGVVWQWMGGSHGQRRKEFNENGVRSKYWFPLNDVLKAFIQSIWDASDCQSSVIVFGEIFGPGVQDLHYGQKGLSHRIFDISVDGSYLDWDFVQRSVQDAGLQTVPVLYRGPFSMQKMNELVDGPTTVASPEEINQPFKGREGIVIKPIKERFDSGLCGRAILKYVSVDYHDRKTANRTEDH
jgi:RNA ligase (TIGR02306 family)